MVNAKLVYYYLAKYDRMMRGQYAEFVGASTWTMKEYTGDDEYYGETSGTDVEYYTKSGTAAIRGMNILHESGHVFNSLPGMDNVFSDALTALDDPSFITDKHKVDTKALLTTKVDDPNYPQGAGAIQASKETDLEAIADVFSNYAAGNINPKTTQGREMYNFATEMLSIYIWHSFGTHTFR